MTTILPQDRTQPVGPPPPFDAELAAALDVIGAHLPSALTAEMIRPMREGSLMADLSDEDLARGGAFTVARRTVPGPAGDPDVELLVLTPAGAPTGLPGLFHTHGGGMVLGNNRSGVDALQDWATEVPAVDTPSAVQMAGRGVWDRTANDTGWTALLGAARGGPDVSPYAAPARAADLSGLPPAFIDVGSAETFRDEDVTYASRIWQAGGQAELHVWPGGFHGFDMLAPQAAVSQEARAARVRWLRRLLGA